MLQNVKNTIVDVLMGYIAPHHCCSCGVTGVLLCEDCKNDIIDDMPNVCMACGRLSGMSGICHNCHPGYSRAWVVGSYHSAVGEMIKVTKFEAARQGAILAGEVLSFTLPALPSNVCIVPIPTIASHRRERGFDHTLMMAYEIASRHGREVRVLLERKANTVQRGKNRRERQIQADGAFKAADVCDPKMIYLLIDDVVTTGASMAAAARCLREAGATEIWAAALARETLDEKTSV